MTLRVTILGCGASSGVPRIDGKWGACDPANPKNARLRSALLIQRFTGDLATNVIVDTGADLRTQIIRSGTKSIDGVLYTHDHADHTHGIDDLRLFTYLQRKLVDLYFNRETGDLLRQRFDYCFASRPGSNYPPIVKGHIIEPGQTFTVSGPGGDIAVTAIRQLHGEMESLGFRIGNMAYSTDLHDLPDDALPFLQELDVWIVGALRYSEHPTHFSVGQALEWADRLKVKHTILTHLMIDLDYEALRRELPEDVEPAYDGLQFELPYDRFFRAP
jgi:phosphoribosyl 1,2-cyclic phosphate phosphodiesterase